MTQQETKTHLKNKLVDIYNRLNKLDTRYVKAPMQILDIRDLTLEAIHILDLIRSDE